MAKYTKEMEHYGELINISDKPQYLNRLIANWSREYSKAFNIYKLTKDQLGDEFVWKCQWIKKKPLRPYRIIGQLTQEVLVVQRTDTNRFYRMPAREVAEAFQLDLELEKDI